MNYRSLAVAAVVAWVIDSIYGFVVFGLMLNSEFARFPAVFRSFETVNSMLPLMLGSSLLAILVVAYIFAMGHEGGSGIQEGLRFGVIFALFGVFGISIPSYVIYNVDQFLAVETAIAAFVEMLVMGLVLGLVYRPVFSRSSRAVAV